MSDNKVNSKCSADIYSDLNYEKQRNENLKRTEELYQKIFSEYSQLYSDYLITQKEAISNPSNAEAKNKSDANRVQKKPVIIELNKKLVNIETELLNNNKSIRQSILDQQKDLNKNNKAITHMEKKIHHLEEKIKISEDKSDTGKYGIKDIQDKSNKLTKWYYLFISLAIIFFMIFIYLFVTTLSEE
jgi:hypothetical protein